ncbi:D-alanyl-D-alanine carboxypeptidase [Nonomuraea solani]|uniref:D-alanyl-D-alanine carboxypeptidase n=1 Tax=Nonomuraea solani TaxID=1144553 RepID=A0A1H6EWW8_9ACTN|nr:Clp protease N-terminal domain-containing protein [Nonomuraea solani]SEH01425.1 D-alanyl-D-alanine carboxypeptidase [Nonomuraea solani]
MSAFDTFLQSVLERAEAEARQEGSATIEARHLLLAIAARDPGAAGLDYQRVKDALRGEFEHSLGSAGVSPGVPPTPTRDPGRRPRLGTTFKLAMERMAAEHRKRDLRPEHLLLGILQAEAGTVPRALALAGIDRAELIERVRSTL